MDSFYVYNNLWQLRQGRLLVFRALDFWSRHPVWVEPFFKLCLSFCFGFHAVRWGLVRDRTLLCQKFALCLYKWLLPRTCWCVTNIYLYLIICEKQIMHSFYVITNLWQLRQGVDFLARWLEHWISDQDVLGLNPVWVEPFFKLCLSFGYWFHAVRKTHTRHL